MNTNLLTTYFQVCIFHCWTHSQDNKVFFPFLIYRYLRSCKVDKERTCHYRSVRKKNKMAASKQKYYCRHVLVIKCTKKVCFSVTLCLQPSTKKESRETLFYSSLPKIGKDERKMINISKTLSIVSDFFCAYIQTFQIGRIYQCIGLSDISRKCDFFFIFASLEWLWLLISYA